jgi:hypothetical protein
MMDVFHELVLYAEEHRSQVCLTLGMLDQTPPAPDGWAYWDAMNPQI